MTTNEQSPGLIVVVDDDAMVATSLSSLLRRDGYRVEKFASSSEALAFMEKTPVDAVLSDISMPGMTGLQMLEHLRTLALEVPVVFVTGLPRIEDTIRAMELGAFRYLTKPVDRDAVSAVMRDAVHWGRLTRASVHSPAMSDRATLEASFTRATASLRMVYQPIVAAASRKPFGYEALMRASEPSMSSPMAILEAAEKLGRLHLLGRQIRALVASQASRQPYDHTFFVNLHSADLADPELLEESSPLATHAHSIVLELTERASLEGISDLERRLSSLREMGYRIAVDDLGAGYAGLSYFARLQPDVVKIDMSLTRDIDADPIKRQVVGMMCQLARALEMLVVAEGIETESEYSCVADLGADLIQGYAVAKPGPYPVTS